MTVAQRPPRNASVPDQSNDESQNGSEQNDSNQTDGESGPTKAKRVAKQNWVLIEVTSTQSKALREMSRVAGGKARDFYTNLLSPTIDQKIAEFETNRPLVSARAKADAAKRAAERAAEIARKAQEELAAAEATDAAKS